MSRRSSVDELHRIGAWFEREWRRRGFARICRWTDSGRWEGMQLSVECADGQTYHQALTYHELEMGGERAIEHWFRVFDDTLHRAEMAWRRRARPIHEEMRIYDQEIRRATGLDRRFLESCRVETFTDFSIDHSETERRSAELFKRMAGEEAFRLLESGRQIAVRGSAGGAYRLRKQASYCVTREGDGARMCAVVPGVPLWDHLLGIKLTIEQDEPRFLRTANVSGAQSQYEWYDV